MNPAISSQPSKGRFALGAAFVLLATLSARAANFDPVAATNQYIAQLPVDAKASSDAYFEGGYWLLLWNLVAALAVSWLLLGTGLMARFRTLAEKATCFRFIHIIVFFALFSFASSLVSLPWDYYTGFYREHLYNLSNLSLSGWLMENFQSFIIACIIAPLVLWLLFFAVRRFPSRWWIYASAGTPFLLILGLLISPVYIAPVFNTYKPLSEGKVRDSILSLARGNGVPVDNVYEFDASKQSNRVSANVSGALGTIRVSLNDNLLKQCSPAEIKSVMAHELGHYVLNHIYKLIIYLSLLIACGFAFTAWFVRVVLKTGFSKSWGLRGADDLASLPLYMVGLALFMFLATPIQNSIIRTTENEADIFGLNAAREPDGFATVALKLSTYRKISPGPWEEILLFDHPSGRSRIQMAMTWKAEHLSDVKNPD